MRRVSDLILSKWVPAGGTAAWTWRTDPAGLPGAAWVSICHRNPGGWQEPRAGSGLLERVGARTQEGKADHMWWSVRGKGWRGLPVKEGWGWALRDWGGGYRPLCGAKTICDFPGLITNSIQGLLGRPRGEAALPTDLVTEGVFLEGTVGKDSTHPLSQPGACAHLHSQVHMHLTLWGSWLRHLSPPGLRTFSPLALPSVFQALVSKKTEEM